MVNITAKKISSTLIAAAATFTIAFSANANDAVQAVETQSVKESAQDLVNISAAKGDGRTGTFKTISGNVSIVRGASTIAAEIGAGLQVADKVITGEKSSAAVTLQDGTTIAIGANTSVDLAQFKFNSTTHEGNMLVDLAKGSLRVVTGLIAKLQPQNVKVTTPTTVIGVRGTDFIVEENI